MHADVDIKAGENILYIPHSFILTVEVVCQTPIGKKMMEKGMRKKYGDYSFFCAYILFERRKPAEQRQFGPFIDSFPQSFDEFPIFFDEDELSYLEGSPFLR